MITFKHTRGPWHRDCGLITNKEGYRIAEMVHPKTQKPLDIPVMHFGDDQILNIAEANATLIATAPELLSALKEAEAWFDDVKDFFVPEVGFDRVCEQIRNAIKKAEGES